MRGRSGPVSCSKFELKTLKVSGATLDEVRAPLVWNRPSAGLYDYHYDVAGLYYQPMITYCMEREQGGDRKVVTIPDRILSNLDKIAYERRKDECDYEGFLTKIYQRRAKDKHSKQIHCANELWSKSKKTTDLNVIRGAATDRDKYLCQVQLLYTGKVAKERQLGRSSFTGDEEVVESVDRRVRRSLSAVRHEEGREEVTRQPVSGDGRYGPGFNKIGRLDSRKVTHGQISGLQLVGVPEPQLGGGLDIEALEEKQVAAAVAKYDRYKSDKEITARFLEAGTQAEFLELKTQLELKRAEAETKEYKPLYTDTSYVRALKDVDRSVKNKVRSDYPLVKIEDINVNFRRRRLDEIGRRELAVIRTQMYKDPSLPVFDIGYDTVERSMICSY